MHHDTMILLPAHNEEPRIAGVIGEVRAAAPRADIVVVDDGSTDGTARVALDAGATVLPHPVNLGYGAALQTGYKHALRQGYDYLAQLDADGQHDPAGLPVLLGRVRDGRCDLCIGSRFLEGGTYAIPRARRAGMWLFRRVASALTGLTITDPTSGFQAMNRRVIEFFTRDLYPTDYPDTDLLVLVHRHALRIAEAPVLMRAAASGQSIHGGMRPVYYLFKMALAIPLNLIRKERP
jgi:glycosyltransferase involved in cell wall biosynthesis